MHWTQFGRVGTSLDSIPKAKIEIRRDSQRDGEHDFERDFERVVRESRPTTTTGADVEKTPGPESQGPGDAIEQAQDDNASAPPDATSPRTNDAGATEQAAPEAIVDVDAPTSFGASNDGAPDTEIASDRRTAPQAAPVAVPGVVTPLPSPTLAVAAPAAQAATAQAPSIGAARTDATSTTAAHVRSSTAHSVRNTTPAIMTEEQHAHLLRRIALAASETGGEMRLLLEPANLGALGVRLRIDGNTLRLELRAEHGEVAALLERDAARLKQDLAERGLDVQDLDIGTSTRDEQQSAQRDFENEHAPTREFLEQIAEDGTPDAQVVMRDATDAIFDAVRNDSFQPDTNSTTRVVIDTIA